MLLSSGAAAQPVPVPVPQGHFLKQTVLVGEPIDYEPALRARARPGSGVSGLAGGVWAV
ncbi:hypothetical protein ACFQT0_13835 [Hymenobacter humi]|uniref:Uncharacterized protein n=1 Tax=Hymenobacter humi TaxID=1411620 RepID=A0ABW2U4D3_9BACT